VVHSGITRKAQKIYLTRSESRLYQSQKKTHRKYTVTDALTDSPPIVDLLVIGGGINGAGVAADAAGRGLSVMLVEKGDLASGTSSWSTKLIHGGLRYLEFYEFGLVRKALLERDVLTKAASHIIRPLAFNIPQLPLSRPAWMLRAGLFLYDFLAKSSVFEHSRAIRFGSDSPLRATITKGFEYWDAQVDDSRLVVLNAQQAAAHGADIRTYTECVALKEGQAHWAVTLKDVMNGGQQEVHARAVVNAAGPWVARLLEKLFAKKPPLDTRLVKGSHIVVPRLHSGDQAFMLQHSDGRVIFVIPYLEDYSLIGTTEAEFDGVLETVQIDEDEIDYLIEVANSYFKTQLSRDDVISTYSGVRPLIDEEGKDATKVSRDYHLEPHKSTVPLLSIYGGKVTTYRTLAEDVMRALAPTFPTMGAPWTKLAPLPGGNYSKLFGGTNRECESGRDAGASAQAIAETSAEDEATLSALLSAQAPWLQASLLKRWLQTYGTETQTLLGDASAASDLGMHLGADLYSREVDYLIAHEWARNADDILWRRTKLGYLFDERAKAALDDYITNARGAVAKGAK